MVEVDVEMLKCAIEQGIIDIDSVQESMKEKERQRILAMHKNEIFIGKDGRHKTYVSDEKYKSGRRLIAKSTRKKLDDELIAYYSLLEDKEEIPDLQSLRDIFPVWLKYKASLTRSSSYMRRIVNDWNKYYKKDTLTDASIYKLDYIALNTWAHDIIKKFAMTKKQYYNMAMILRQSLDYCVEKGILNENPFNKVRIKSKMFVKTQKPKSNTQVFMEDEEPVVMKYCLDAFNRSPKFVTPLAILLNFHLGLRVGELVAIKFSDIENNYIHIQRMEVANYIIDDNGNAIRNGVIVEEYTKSEAGDRELYVNTEAREILHLIKKTNLKYGYHDGDYVFVNYRNNRLTTGSINKYLYKICDNINVNRKSSHKIRKTYLSSLIDSGLNINKVREIAGHEDEETTLHNYCFDRHVDDKTENILEKRAVKVM